MLVLLGFCTFRFGGWGCGRLLTALRVVVGGLEAVGRGWGVASGFGVCWIVAHDLIFVF